jgi:hypothetical protein
MDLDFVINGEAVMKVKLDEAVLRRFLSGKPPAQDGESEPVKNNEAKAPPKAWMSTPMAREKAVDLLARVDARSANLLRQIAANNGEITWGEARSLLGVKNWDHYATGLGKGITRVLRHVLGNRSARLIWWVDKEWEDKDNKDRVLNDELGECDHCKLYIDGPALEALRSAAELAA